MSRTKLIMCYCIGDVVEETFGSGWNLDVGGEIEVFHVVRALSFFSDISFACASECLDGVCFPLLHLHVRVSLNTGDRFSCMDVVWVNRMSIQVLDNLHWVNLAIHLDLIRCHHLFDQRSQLPQSHIYPSLSHPSIGGILDSFQQLVVFRVECNCEGSVDNSSIDLGSEVDLAHIIILENCVIACVGSVMCSNIVKRASCGESYSSSQRNISSQFSIIVLQLFTDIDESSSWLSNSLSKPSDLPLNFGSLPQILKMRFQDSISRFSFSRSDSWDFVLLNLVGSVPLHHFVGKLNLYGSLPSPQASEQLILLGFNILEFRGIHLLLILGSLFPLLS